MNTILVVEDTLPERRLLLHYLQQGGYNVIIAIDAQDALDKAINLQPDAVITDIIMPGMSGLELCSKLKNNPATARLPVIICSSKNQEINRLWGMKQGADIYITKPFTQEQILRAIKSVLI